ncbi:MAG: hypothetical protein Tp1123DCM1511741_33 [Prokaryotic dsDNA virus sp.]|nr:MAG: hypothetical protein Tp1123DCM1511741_33 [Prokaryotic dsDNA virus sp.]|tara:strand:- start:13726 stop:14427 length:702 start_codon:yes stop_codon:yes gene_type:complete
MEKRFKFIDIGYSKLNLHGSPTKIGKHRFYEVQNKMYPSVSTVLNAKPKEWLIRWKKNVGEDVAKHIQETSSARGSAVHKLIEDYLRGAMQQEIFDTLPCSLFLQMKPELDMYINNIHLIEEHLFGNKIGLAGRVDCIAEYDGTLSVIDFKTSTKHKKYMSKEHGMQCAGYALMYEEMFNTKIEQLVIINTSEESTVETHIKPVQKYIEPLQEEIEWFNKNIMINLTNEEIII